MQAALQYVIEENAVKIAEKVILNGTKYRFVDFLPIDHNEQFVVFGKINALILGPEAMFLLSTYCD